MGAFTLLLRISVAHPYYADGLCRALRLTPCAETADLLRRRGFIVRSSADGVQVHGESADLPPTHWLGRCADPAFAACTEGLAPGADELLYFDADHALREPDGTWRLHAAPEVSRQDLRSVKDAAFKDVLSPAERRVPPHFVVRASRIGPGPEEHGRRLQLRFQARRTVWKYCPLGDWSGEPLQVVDLGRDIEFGPAEPEPLDDGLQALAIRSATGISLQERAPQRFQLRTRGGIEKVLVKRLPVAGVSQFSRETIAGVPTLVSEIYVHR